MKNCLRLLCIASGLAMGACSGSSNCGCNGYDWQALIPGPQEAGYDAALEAKARRYDRGFAAIFSHGTGLNQEFSIPLADEAARAAVRRFFEEDDGFDFEAFSGLSLADIGQWHKVAGGYAGPGVAADAFRYGVMRDQRYPAAQVEQAREQLLRGLEGLHRAAAIPGVPGVIARGLARKDLPGYGQSASTVPLFDGQGKPLPEEKNNGTWREDNSGLYPEYVWEDSCSRDMYIGWVIGMAAAWEVARDDADIPQAAKDALREDARLMLRELMKVRPSGYDLEIIDADGRTTYHGYMNENNIDRAYLPGARNGFYSLMALGCVAGLLFVSGDETGRAYLDEQLIAARDLPGICRENLMMVDMGVYSNYSNYNMAFDGAWLALRYLDNPAALDPLWDSLQNILYDRPGADRQPSEIAQSFFDFAYAAGRAGGGVHRIPREPPDEAALARGLGTLREFPDCPYWDTLRENCDEGEVAALHCVADDGTILELLGDVGRGEKLVASTPIPMRIRPPSNYHWRSNPFAPNGGGDGSQLLPGVDFRFAYWLGRWVRR